MIYTTLDKIRRHTPCVEKWTKLLGYLSKTKADDEPLGLDVILKANGLADALWCLQSVPEESKRWQLLSVAFARTVQHHMTDRRSLDALDVAERHAHGRATDGELATAYDAACAATWDAAWASPWAAAEAAAGAAACDPARAAVGAAWAPGAPHAWARLTAIFLEHLQR